eukprot:9270613-Prorocentrum_lima.AAC.1
MGQGVSKEAVQRMPKALFPLVAEFMTACCGPNLNGKIKTFWPQSFENPLMQLSWISGSDQH